METKVNFGKANIILKSSNHPNYIKFPADGLAERFVMWKSPNFILDILLTNARFIHCSIKDMLIGLLV